jgi:putative pyruvate formate lyase activating enzyme
MPDFDARTALARYFSVVDGGEKARFLGCGDLPDRVVRARDVLKSCRLCERRCGVDRTAGQRGYCRVLESKVSSEFIHIGEEPEIVPSYTVFFAGCTFKCVFCQNWDISQNPENGVHIPPEDMVKLIDTAAGINVNWVGGDPTPNLAYILEVLSMLERNIPQVWNSNMYLTEESMSLLDGVIDVYLTDFKYGNNRCSRKYSDAPHYFETVSRNHLLAAEQAEVVIRHLVLPGHVECCSKPVLTWIADKLGSTVRVNVMNQYRPEYKARRFKTIDHRLGLEEYHEARDHARELGLNLV